MLRNTNLASVTRAQLFEAFRSVADSPDYDAGSAPGSYAEQVLGREKCGNCRKQ